MSRHKIGFSIAIFLALFLLVRLIMPERSKGPAFSDADLIPSRTAVPVASNAYWVLAQAADQLYWPEAVQRKLNDVSDDKTWDDAFVSDLLERNEPCLLLFETSLKQPELLIAEPKASEEEYPYLGAWKFIGRLASVRAASLLKAGKEEEAYTAALDIVRFGHRIENSGGPILHCLVGTSVKIIGLRRINKITAQTSLNPAHLASIIRALNRYWADETALTNTLKVEYRLKSKALDNFAAGNFSPTNSAWDQISVSVGMKPLFSASKTRAKFAQATRVLLESVPMHFSEMPLAEIPGPTTNRSGFKQLLAGNAVGDVLYDIWSPAWENFMAKKCQENVHVAAAQLLLALKAFHIKNLRLPSALDELVPEFLPQVPVDDFDGMPFRYSVEKRLIYSVGQNLNDDGGQEFGPSRERLDMPFKIDFESDAASNATNRSRITAPPSQPKRP
jgi:hypothetical protein